MSTRNIIIAVLAVAFIIFIVVVGGTQKAPAPIPIDKTSTPVVANTPETQPAAETNSVKAVTTAVMTTNKGIITFEFYSKDAPNTVANFVKLAKEGFYNGVRFHRVVKGFMIQGGDPNSKDVSKQGTWGQGDPGYKFNDEIDPTSALYKTGYQRGVLAMANSGVNTNGSQFFIMHQDYPLTPNYTIFGKVISGLETVDNIANVETTMNASGEKSLPVEDIIIQKIEIK